MNIINLNLVRPVISGEHPEAMQTNAATPTVSMIASKHNHQHTRHMFGIILLQLTTFLIINGIMNGER